MEIVAAPLGIPREHGVGVSPCGGRNMSLCSSRLTGSNAISAGCC